MIPANVMWIVAVVFGFVAILCLGVCFNMVDALRFIKKRIDNLESNEETVSDTFDLINDSLRHIRIDIDELFENEQDNYHDIQKQMDVFNEYCISFSLSNKHIASTLSAINDSVQAFRDKYEADIDKRSESDSGAISEASRAIVEGDTDGDENLSELAQEIIMRSLKGMPKLNIDINAKDAEHMKFWADRKDLADIVNPEEDHFGIHDDQVCYEWIFPTEEKPGKKVNGQRYMVIGIKYGMDGYKPLDIDSEVCIWNGYHFYVEEAPQVKYQEVYAYILMPAPSDVMGMVLQRISG